MKKMIVFLCGVGMALIFVAAALPSRMKPKQDTTKNTGCGYRIIEFGLAVNCNGDTVKLAKSKGFQQLASQH
jgi:hypothetical protein